MKFNKEKITQILQERGATKPCQRCGHTFFAVIDGFFNFPVHAEISNDTIIGGPNVPSALTACVNCGAINAHALGSLGLLDDQEEPNDG